MKHLACMTALAGALLASGCSPTAADTVLLDRPWQVIGIYTSPDSPSVIPNAITRPPSLTFGTRGVVGTSGCAQFRAQADYFHEGEPANIADADTVRLDSFQFKPMEDDCRGEQLWAHNQITRILGNGRVFSINTAQADQITLTLQDGQVESPSLRLVSQIPQEEAQ